MNGRSDRDGFTMENKCMTFHISQLNIAILANRFSHIQTNVSKYRTCTYYIFKSFSVMVRASISASGVGEPKLMEL